MFSIVSVIFGMQRIRPGVISRYALPSSPFARTYLPCGTLYSASIFGGVARFFELPGARDKSQVLMIPSKDAVITKRPSGLVAMLLTVEL